MAPACPVVSAWAAVEILMQRAANGKLAEARGKLTRQTCIDNRDLLVPLIQEFGALVQPCSTIDGL